MKAFKKMMALILAVSMLVGMFTIVDVAAVPVSYGPKATAALIVPDQWTNPGTTSGKTVAMYFNGIVLLGKGGPWDNARAAFVLVNKDGYCDFVTYQGNSVVSYWPATYGLSSLGMPGGGVGNNLTVTLVNPIDTIADIIAARDAYNAANPGNQLTLAVRMYEVNMGGIDNVLNAHGLHQQGVEHLLPATNHAGTGCDNNGMKFGAGGEAYNVNDYTDVVVTSYDKQSGMQLQTATYDNGKLTVKFSDGLYYDGGCINAAFRLRVVNSKGEFVYVNKADWSYKTESQLAGTSGYEVIGTGEYNYNHINIEGETAESFNGAHAGKDTIVYDFATHISNLSLIPTYEYCLAVAAQLNATGEDSYYVALVLEEVEMYNGTTDMIDIFKGEFANNGFIDDVYNADGSPLVAYNWNLATDRAIVPIVDVTGVNNTTVSDITINKVDGDNNDFAVFTFNNAVSFKAPAGAMYFLAAFNGDEYTQLWALSNWNVYSADSKQWAAQLSADYEAVEAARAAGQDLKLIIFDRASDFKGDKQINHVTDVRGFNALYANKVYNLNGKNVDAAVIAINNVRTALQISNVGVYDKNNYVINFNMPVSFNNATITFSDGDNTWLVDNYRVYSDTALLVPAFEANYGGSLTTLIKETAGIGNNFVVDGVYATADPSNKLAAAIAGAQDTAACSTNNDTYANADMLDVKVMLDNNYTILVLNEQIQSVDGLSFLLVDGDHVMNATLVKYEGNRIYLSVPAHDHEHEHDIYIKDSNNDCVVSFGGNKILFANVDPSTAEVHISANSNVVAMIGDTPYAQYNTAMNAATSGQTVVLVANIAMPDFVTMVNPGVTLDLNGHLIMVNNFISFGNVVDSSEGLGIIMISDDSTKAFANFQANNTTMPLYDEASAGYRFFTVSLVNKGTKSNGGDEVAYGVHISLPNRTAYSLLGNSKNANIALKYTLTLNNAYSYVYTMEGAKVTTFANKVCEKYDNADEANIYKSTLVLYVYGFDSVPADTVLAVDASINSTSTIVAGPVVDIQ